MSADKLSLEILHDLLAEELARAIKDGVPVKDESGSVHKAPAPAALLNVALGLLRHNGIQCKPTKDNALGNLVKTLPFAGVEAVDEAGKPITH